MLCRLKIIQIKQERIKDIGFIDPYINHSKTLELNPNDVEDNLLRALMQQHQKEEILFRYNYS